MGIELIVKITTPLDDDDHNLLSGVAVLVLAIANRELAKERFPETFPDDEEAGAGDANEQPHPCGMPDRDGPRRTCVGAVAHVGRHRFRPTATVDPGSAPKLPN